MFQEAVHERKRAEQALKEVEEIRRWRLQAKEQEEILVDSWRELEEVRADLRKQRRQLAGQREALLDTFRAT
jgi:predicted nucleotide-binding protein (sugar kinase/HSP70/actin superfamily)